MVIEQRLPVWESSTRIAKFYAPTGSEHKFNRKSKIGYPWDSIWDHLDWEPAVITTTLCSTANGKSLRVLYTHPKSLGITLETFHFPESVQVFSNPTSITQRRKINHQWLNHLQTPHTL